MKRATLITVLTISILFICITNIILISNDLYLDTNIFKDGLYVSGGLLLILMILILKELTIK